MNISAINQTNYSPNKPIFTSWGREVYEKNAILTTKRLLHCNDTCFFRDSEFWAKLTSYLVDKYKDVPKVNVYSYGCSDGSEPFTFAMRMLSIHGKENAEKFLPITAKDYDEVAIEKVTTKKPYLMMYEEKEDINYYTKGEYKRYFQDVKQNSNQRFVVAKPELYENVKFSVANIFKDYKNIKSNNSVVMARNFWPYIETWKDRQYLLNKIGKQLGIDSVLVVGDYDLRATEYSLYDQIISAGFKPTPIEFVFEKATPASRMQKMFSLFSRIF